MPWSRSWSACAVERTCDGRPQGVCEPRETGLEGSLNAAASSPQGLERHVRRDAPAPASTRAAGRECFHPRGVSPLPAGLPMVPAALIAMAGPQVPDVQDSGRTGLLTRM